MSTHAKSAKKAESVPQAQTRQILVKLKEVTINEDLFYCHRNGEELTRPNLKELMQSLRTEGLQTPPEVFKDEDGTYALLKGHRRITSLRMLATDGVPDFSLDMDIPVIEVLNATPQDRLVRSLDSELHKALSKTERVKAIRKADDAGVPAERGADAFGMKPKTYQRMLKIARNPWMFHHVEQDHLPLTYAFMLLDAAEKANRPQEVAKDLAGWVVRTEQMICREERIQQQCGGQLRPAEKVIKNRCTRQLIDHWIKLIKEGQRLTDEAIWRFRAVVEKKTGRVRIPAVTINLKEDPQENLVEFAGRCGYILKETMAALRKRREEEGTEGAQTLPGESVIPYDLELFRQHGMDDVADKLKEKVEPEDELSQDLLDDLDDEDESDDTEE